MMRLGTICRISYSVTHQPGDISETGFSKAKHARVIALIPAVFLGPWRDDLVVAKSDACFRAPVATSASRPNRRRLSAKCAPRVPTRTRKRGVPAALREMSLADDCDGLWAKARGMGEYHYQDGAVRRAGFRRRLHRYSR